MKQGFNYIIIIVLFITGMMFVACSDNPSEGKVKSLEQQYLEENDINAKTQLANLLHQYYSLYHLEHPGDTLFLRTWAEMAFDGQEFALAEELYSKLIELGVSNAATLARCGQINARLGYFLRAASYYQQAIQFERNHQLTDQYTQLYLFYSHTDSVISEATNLIKKGVLPERNLLSRASQLMKCKHFSAAVSDVNRVLELDSASLSAQLLLAEIYIESDEYKLASSILTKLPEQMDVDIAGQHRELTYRLEKLLKIRDLEVQLKQAAVSYEKLVAITSMLFEISEYGRARDYASELVRFYPDSTLGYLYKGQAYIQLGNPGAAIRDFDEVIRLKPSNVSARNLKAYCYLLLGQADNMKEQLTEIKALNGEVLDVMRKYLND